MCKMYEDVFSVCFPTVHDTPLARLFGWYVGSLSNVDHFLSPCSADSICSNSDGLW